MNKIEAQSIINNQNIEHSEFKCGYSTSNTGIAKFENFSAGEYGVRIGPCPDCTRKEFLPKKDIVQILVLEPEMNSKDIRLIEASCYGVLTESSSPDCSP